TPPIDGGPLALRLSRRELAGISIVIETLNQAVDPSETQRLANRILVSHGFRGSVALVEHQPDPWIRCMVLSQPCPPSLAVGNLQRHEFRRHAGYLNKY